MMHRMIPALVALLATGSAQAQNPAHVPEAVKARVNALVAQCAAAGGTLGAMTGQGRFVIPAELTGDGRTDFLISEGNVPCTGRPQLFREGGQSRVEVWVQDAGGNAHLAFADRLMAYRMVPGSPAKVQIARTGAACGPGVARCGDELRWNAAAGRFEEHATDGRALAARPATGAVAAAPAAAAPVEAAAASAGATTEATFRASCRAAILKAQPSAAKWVDEECRDRWAKVVAAGPLADNVLALHGRNLPLAEARKAMSGVQWTQGSSRDRATGKLGKADIALSGGGNGPPAMLRFEWSEQAAPIPYDLVGALRARGATVAMTICEKQGPGAGNSQWTAQLPGRQPIVIDIDQQMAPLGHMQSYYSAGVALGAGQIRRGNLKGCDFLE